MGQYTDIEVSPVTLCTHCSGVFHHTGCDITITREKCVFSDCLAVVLEVTGFHWVKSVTKKVLHKKNHLLIALITTWLPVVFHVCLQTSAKY